MRPRYAVPLTPSKSSHPTQLPSRQHFVRVSPLDATLMISLVSVADKRLTTRLSPLDATLTKNVGEGGVPNFPARLSLQAGTHPFPYPLSPIPFVFTALRTLLRNGTCTTLFQSISYALFSSRRRVYPSHCILDLATRRQLSHCASSALFFTSLLRYLSARFARLLLHCSPHGSPTPRPTLPRRSPLARRDRARYSR